MGANLVRSKHCNIYLAAARKTFVNIASGMRQPSCKNHVHEFSFWKLFSNPSFRNNICPSNMGAVRINVAPTCACSEKKKKYNNHSTVFTTHFVHR